MGNQVVECQLLNGYGRIPVDRAKLSEANARLFDQGRSCVTIAQVPFKDGDWVSTKTVVVLSPPTKNERESTTVFFQRMFPVVKAP